MPPPLLLDPAQLDLNRVVADQEAIRKINQQRFEMEQLTAVVLMDPAQHLVAGFKDVRADEFWVRGHMPDYPLMPGVLMCEAAAQLSSYYCKEAGLFATGFVGFGGMEDVRFRGQVRPGDRLVLVGKGVRLHRRHSIFEVQGFVGSNMVFHGKVIGVMLAAEEEAPG